MSPQVQTSKMEVKTEAKTPVSICRPPKWRSQRRSSDSLVGGQAEVLLPSPSPYSLSLNTEPPLPPKGGNRIPKFDANEITIPTGIDTPEFRAAWTDWREYRREIRKGLTQRSACEQLEAMSRAGPGAAIAAIRRSIQNSWTGVFPEKEVENANRRTNGNRIHAGSGQVFDPGAAAPAGVLSDFG